MEFHFATFAELKEIHGDVPIPSVRALVFTEGGVRLGICGVKYDNGYLVAFSELFVPDIPKVKIWRAAKIFIKKLVKDRGFPVLAVTDNEASARFLVRLGFEFLSEDNEGDVYICK